MFFSTYASSLRTPWIKRHKIQPVFLSIASIYVQPDFSVYNTTRRWNNSQN